MLHDKQLFKEVPFHSTKYKKKELCVDNKVREIIGDVYCPTCRNEKCVYISTNKTTSFRDCKKCKTCCNVLNIPFKDHQPTIMLFGGDGTHCLHESRLRKKSHFLFWLNFSTNHNQTHPNLNQKRLKGVRKRNELVRFLLVDDLNHIIIFQIILFKFILQSTSQI